MNAARPGHRWQRTAGPEPTSALPARRPWRWPRGWPDATRTPTGRSSWCRAALLRRGSRCGTACAARCRESRTRLRRRGGGSGRRACAAAAPTPPRRSRRGLQRHAPTNAAWRCGRARIAPRASAPTGPGRPRCCGGLQALPWPKPQRSARSGRAPIAAKPTRRFAAALPGRPGRRAGARAGRRLRAGRRARCARHRSAAMLPARAQTLRRGDVTPPAPRRPAHRAARARWRAPRRLARRRSGSRTGCRCQPSTHRWAAALAPSACRTSSGSGRCGAPCRRAWPACARRARAARCCRSSRSAARRRWPQDTGRCWWATCGAPPSCTDASAGCRAAGRGRQRSRRARSSARCRAPRRAGSRGLPAARAPAPAHGSAGWPSP